MAAPQIMAICVLSERNSGSTWLQHVLEVGMACPREGRGWGQGREHLSFTLFGLPIAELSARRLLIESRFQCRRIFS